MVAARRWNRAWVARRKMQATRARRPPAPAGTAALGLPKSATINVFYDRSRLVGRAVDPSSGDLGEATVLVMVLLAPVSRQLASFAGDRAEPAACDHDGADRDRAVGMSANLMLGVLAIAIGMLIDALVVVVENIVGNLSKDQEGRTTPLIHTVCPARSARCWSRFQRACSSSFSCRCLRCRASRESCSPQRSQSSLHSPPRCCLRRCRGCSGSETRFTAQADPRTGPRLIRLTFTRLRTCAWLGTGQRAQGDRRALAALVATRGLPTPSSAAFIPTMDEGDIIVSVEAIPSVNLDQANAIDERLQAAILVLIVQEYVLKPDRTNWASSDGAQSDRHVSGLEAAGGKKDPRQVLLLQLRQVLGRLSGTVTRLHATDRHARPR